MMMIVMMKIVMMIEDDDDDDELPRRKHVKVLEEAILHDTLGTAAMNGGYSITITIIATE